MVWRKMVRRGRTSKCCLWKQDSIIWIQCGQKVAACGGIKRVIKIHDVGAAAFIRLQNNEMAFRQVKIRGTAVFLSVSHGLVVLKCLIFEYFNLDHMTSSGIGYFHSALQSEKLSLWIKAGVSNSFQIAGHMSLWLSQA